MTLRIFIIAFLLILAGASGSGCSKKVADNTMAQTEQSAEAEDAARNLEEAKRLVVLEKIYFAFDSSDLNSRSREVLTRKAEVLRQEQRLRVIIEGHCDERGSNEYNLALGERRAQAAFRFLVNLGITASQLETISYGEERPADAGHGEAAWALNRRDEFRLVW